MKKVFFKKSVNKKDRTKMVLMSSRTEDRECITDMRKSFEYKVSKDETIDLHLEAPEVHIRKILDTKKKIEKFYLKVNGKFYTKSKGIMLRIDFCHTLNIEIQWKTKIFSPKKSEILT